MTLTEGLLVAILVVLLWQNRPKLRLPYFLRRWRYQYWTNRKAKKGFRPLWK